VTVNYGDGTPLYINAMPPAIPWPNGQVLSPTHSYPYSGVYWTNVTIANNFDTFIFNCSITVIGKIENVSLISNSPVPMINGAAAVKLWFYSLRPPVVTSLIWDYNDSKSFIYIFSYCLCNRLFVFNCYYLPPLHCRPQINITLGITMIVKLNLN